MKIEMVIASSFMALSLHILFYLVSIYDVSNSLAAKSNHSTHLPQLAMGILMLMMKREACELISSLNIN